MSVNLGTIYSPLSTAYPHQRKLLKSSNGTLLLFSWFELQKIQYKVSTDNGDTWGAWIDVETYYVAGGSYPDVIIDDSDNIYVTWAYIPSKIIYLRKLTYSAGSWSVGSLITVSTSSVNGYPTIIKRANNQLFVTTRYTSGGVNDLYAFYSDDDGANWSSDYINISSGYLNINATVSLIVGTTIWAITYYADNLVYNIWDDNTNSWGSTQTIATSLPRYYSEMGVGKVSDSEIYIAVTTSGGVKVFKYTSSWDAGSLLSSNTYDNSPSVSIINNKPIITWSDSSDNAIHNIVYRVWNGSIWESQASITSDSLKNKNPSTIKSHSGTLYVCWVTGSIAPYILYFEKVIFSTEVISDINNDFRFVKNYALDDISNDFRMISTVSYYDISNDFRISGAELDDIDNDFRMVGTFVRADIINDFRMIETPPTITVTDDIYNLFNMVGSILNDVTNDIRTQKEEINDITNDFRMIAAWQIPGDVGFESLGKEYIKVYIDDVEQTDVDVNSVVINKELNSAHIASFDLGRAYDSTKPDTKATVEIKYNEWTIYKGYVVNISPADSPESIRINCNDKYWLRNRTKKYFHVGHKPQDDQELYYDTPKLALSTECDFSVAIGNFVPETIDCFGQGESDCISSLIQESGNYGWFYKEDETKKLWEGGKGSIVNISPQTLGTNINLHQIIRHQFDDAISGIVNKFRVQMGEKIVRTFDDDGGAKTYSGYRYSNYNTFAEPAWDSNFENTYGSINDTVSKNDMYVKYRLPYLDSQLESWTDRYPPKIELYNPGGRSYISFGRVIGELTEGFTIDYENGLLILDAPLFNYNVDGDGNVISVRRPNIKLYLFKKIYYSFTASPSEDPETDVSNPLMFFTDKMGSYSDTIIENLELTSLSIQEGLVYNDTEGNEIVIPSWDDTDFAKDFADWELSKVCDEKISGSIDITLDTFLFYGIDLSKRIMIDGVIDSPLNITSISINTSTFIVTLKLETIRNYERTVSLQSRGE